MMANDFYAPIKPEIRRALNDYAEHGIPVGSFLTAVLSNDLMQAIGRADDGNRATLWQICGYIHNEMPSPCHGSLEAVKAWIAKHERKRESELASTGV